ncbi:MAG: MerR family transcriptional regulator [Chloroflexia bacterium]
MRIGELARRSEVTVRTIHYYIEQGLLPAPPRRAKYGEFDESYVDRLRLIRQLKEQGLPLSAIRRRLMEMGFGPKEGEGGSAASRSAAVPGNPPPEGLFRSRFAEEAGLTPEQVARLEAMGLLSSSEGLLPASALPLARAVGTLLAYGATMEDIALLAGHVQQEALLHRRLVERSGLVDAVARAVRWQELVAAAGAVRQMVLWEQLRSEAGRG